MAEISFAASNEPMQATTPAAVLGNHEHRRVIVVEVEPVPEYTLMVAAHLFWTSFAAIAVEALLSPSEPDVRAA